MLDGFGEEDHISRVDAGTGKDMTGFRKEDHPQILPIALSLCYENCFIGQELIAATSFCSFHQDLVIVAVAVAYAKTLGLFVVVSVGISLFQYDFFKVLVD